MVSEILNIGKIMRNQAWLRKSKRKIDKFRVSPDAVQELRSFIECGVEVAMVGILEVVEQSNHPQTVKSEDIICYFNRSDSSVFADPRED